MTQTEMMRARILVNRTRLYNRLCDALQAFDLEDLSSFTPTQQRALSRARVLVNAIQKGTP